MASTPLLLFHLVVAMVMLLPGLFANPQTLPSNLLPLPMSSQLLPSNSIPAPLKASRNLNQYFFTKAKFPVPPHDTTSKTIFNSNPTCQLVQVQLLSRHGTRNPSKRKTEIFSNLERFLQSQSNPLLKTWSSPFQRNTSSKLNHQGRLDLFLAAERAKVRFARLGRPDIFRATVGNLQVQAANSSRVIESARAFLSNIVGGDKKAANYNMTVLPRNRDKDLVFFESCPRYVARHSSQSKDLLEDNVDETSENRNDRDIESLKFGRSIFPRIISNIEAKAAGLEGLERIHVIAMYELCAYNHEIFCDLFSDEDLEALEYFMDLKLNFRKGYSHSFHQQMTCSLTSTLFNNMNNKAAAAVFSNKKNYTDSSLVPPDSILKFAHDSTLLPFLTSIGLYRDEFPLAADTPIDQRSRRKWKISEIMPFASNIWFELFRCEDGYKVRMLHNEREVVIPGCPDVICPLERMNQILKQNLNCEFDKICSVQNNKDKAKSADAERAVNRSSREKPFPFTLIASISIALAALLI